MTLRFRNVIRRITLVLLCACVCMSMPVEAMAMPAATDPATETDNPTSQHAPVVNYDVVIAQIQVGRQKQSEDVPADANDEYIALRNNGMHDVDITGWCLYAKNSVQLMCFDGPNDEWVVQPGQYVGVSGLKSQVSYSASAVFAKENANRIAAGADTITLMAGDSLIDSISWGSQPSGSYAIERVWDLTTGNLKIGAESWHWQKALSRYGYITEPIECNDQHGTLAMNESQCPALPVVVCKNYPDLTTLPPNFERDDDGICYENQCANLPGFYHTVPRNFARESGSCLLTIQPLEVTELLPNPSSTDAGNEFIELYNPNDEVVDLKWWSFTLNDTSKLYAFPDGASIAAKSYYLLKNSEVIYSLNNTAGSLTLKSSEGQYRDDVPTWTSSKDDQAWAKIDSSWQYTSQPTPGAPNVASLLGGGSVDDSPLTACPAGKYRNPETNRCKSYATSMVTACKAGQERNPATNRCRSVTATTNSLVSCKPGQVRNPATNRCRSATLASATLTPCKVGQERNPETNRCRSIASAGATLKSCTKGQERNPETNRCRKVAGATLGATDFPVEPVKDTATAFAGWWALGGVILLGIGYAGWEYRHEVATIIKRVIPKGKS